MKSVVILLLLIASFLTSKAQSVKGDPNEINKIEIKERPDTTKKTEFTEREPLFPGGPDKFVKYVVSHISSIYKTDGKVYVKFVIEKDGSLSDVKVVRGISKDVDDDIVRIVQSSPKWHPGIQHGQPVRVQYTVAIDLSTND